jgi:hypothetical protein
MKTPRLIFSFALIFFVGIHTAVAGWGWDTIKDEAEDALRGSMPLTNEEVIRGLREALVIGTKNSTNRASRINGFYKNPRIRIPFPPEAQKIKKTVESLGMKSQVDKFVLTLNRAAEEAAKQAAPIFIDAIKSITIQDGFAILNGGNDAATKFLKRKTSRPLFNKFQPVAKKAIDKVQVTRYWNPIITRYNQIPMVERIDPDLDRYVTQRALKGLFKLIAAEELKIRKDPKARVTELLRRVFGNN